jgi:hypothetical protein
MMQNILRNQQCDLCVFCLRSLPCALCALCVLCPLRSLCILPSALLFLGSLQPVIVSGAATRLTQGRTGVRAEHKRDASNSWALARALIRRVAACLLYRTAFAHCMQKPIVTVVALTVQKRGAVAISGVHVYGCQCYCDLDREDCTR